MQKGKRILTWEFAENDTYLSFFHVKITRFSAHLKSRKGCEKNLAFFLTLFSTHSNIRGHSKNAPRPWVLTLLISNMLTSCSSSSSYTKRGWHWIELEDFHCHMGIVLCAAFNSKCRFLFVEDVLRDSIIAMAESSVYQIQFTYLRLRVGISLSRQ